MYFLRLEEAPRKVALGFALGVLVGMTPFWGVHIPTSLLITAVLRWSKLAAVLGVQITNVGTAPFIYPLNYWVGLKLTGVSQAVAWPRSMGYHQMFEFIEQSPLILVDLCVGGLVLGIPLAVASYFAVLKAMHAWRRYSPVKDRLMDASQPRSKISTSVGGTGEDGSLRSEKTCQVNIQ
jgi:uncharacterized protein (DUF2062 family)